MLVWEVMHICSTVVLQVSDNIFLVVHKISPQIVLTKDFNYKATTPSTLVSIFDPTEVYEEQLIKGEPLNKASFPNPAENNSPQSATMRAKRSKKYRKTMSAYQQAFSFREPYQVLLDSHFLKACHAFHMPLQRYLGNTLHGECRLFITQCTIAKVMADFEKEKEKLKASGGKPRGRPEFLPPPLEAPMRYCKHKNNEGEELGVIGESRCLLDLLAGQPHGNEMAKNKQHYILATAEPDEREVKRKGYFDVRERARMIPGVPVVYVKRSVMILEPLSRVSEKTKTRAEVAKFSEGLVDTRKRKRGEGADGEGSSDEEEPDEHAPAQGVKSRGMKRAKGPNPLSVKKKKKKVKLSGGGSEGGVLREEGAPKKRTRRGNRGKGKGKPGGLDNGPASEQTHAAIAEPPSTKQDE